MSYQTKVRSLQGGDEFVVSSGGKITVETGATVNIDGDISGESVVQNLRSRVSAAQVNAGHELLGARDGFKYRIVDMALIAIGGNAATATTVDILGTLSTSRKLLAAEVAGLTENTLLRAGATNALILAGGASFTANDANTAITIGKTGSNLATATHIDVLLNYVVERA